MSNYHHRNYCRRLSLLPFAVMAVAFLSCVECKAQAVDPKEAFEAFRKQAQQSYSNFRQQCLKEYTDFVRNAWQAFEGKAPIPVPKDDMLPPVVKPKEDEQKPAPEPKPVVIEEVVTPAPVPPQPEPVEPVIEQPRPMEETIAFTFFGTEAKVRYEKSKGITLRSVSGNDVADALVMLGDGRCDNMLYDCLALRRSHNLCDWAYLMMLRELSNTVYGKGTNEAVLLMSYLYMQSGYRMRLGEADGRLYMIFASDFVIYELTGYYIDGTYYYGVEKLPDRLNISLASFPKESNMSLYVGAGQVFGNSQSEKRQRKSKRYPDVNVSVVVNTNWLDFCSTYPTSMIGDNFVSRWAMYANTPLSDDVKEQLYPQLKGFVEGQTELKAANILLNWVQTGFEYEYDDKVWGHDRAFFAEESLYYPYCDCEDRSILFTRLIRDLLGLDCLLIYYPGHLACAVNFTELVSGDYIELDGKKYIVTDPTYIGASVGATMPGMDNKSATVILLE